jgi:hypothetical protein
MSVNKNAGIEIESSPRSLGMTVPAAQLYSALTRRPPELVRV